VEQLRILVVDDDAAVGRFVCAVLEQAGHLVHLASDLEGARRIAASQQLDLLISDVVLGAVDGLDVAEAVRLLQPRLKTLFMSGYARPRYKSGAEDPVLAKPFGPADLVERIDAIFAPASTLQT
jgi:two-component system, cell cycle sensor histidine kinase and response regulator CckA